jgi:Mrp family chromosome partitioning ATPase
MSQVRPGVLIALIVFAVFAAYAFLAPATYRTSALLVIDAVGPANALNLPEPLEAARRLSEAVLDRSTLERLSRERAGSGAADAIAQAASSVRQALEIDTSDARSYSIGYKDTDPARAQRACNQLAHHALELAPQVLVDHSAERASDLKRQEQTEELAAFLAQHPQVAAEPPPSSDKAPDKDPALSAFHAEKSNLEQRILELESGRGSDNPYVDPRLSDLTLLRRRLVEINTALSARRDAVPSATPLSPELKSQWKILLDALTQSNALADSAVTPTLSGRLVSAALLPSSPVDPNRRLVLFFGVVLGLGLGATFTVGVRAVQQKRPKSDSPPAPVATQGALPPPMLSAPALPSGLGPEVPVTPPPSNRAPPIVPIPLRQISSSPPRVFNAGTDLVGAAQDSAAVEERKNSISSRPPGVARPFASTFVLPASENPSPLVPPMSEADPVLASANQVWEQQIRAHDVPGFAVVMPGSEPPPPRAPFSTPPSLIIDTRVASSTPPAPGPAKRSATRPPNQMKVTQPLGSFLPEGGWHDLTKPFPPQSDESARSSAAPSYSAGPPQTPVPASESRYSYVSTVPAEGPTQQPSSRPPVKDVIRMQGVPMRWHPDPSLTPEAQRALCEQLYPFAVESCFVLTVVSVAESSHYKSRVAAELALALAESGHPRILLLEGDFHRPWVQRTLNVDMPMGAGFSQQLRHRMTNGDKPPWKVMAAQNSLHVLAEGVMRLPGLILSKQFPEALKELRSYYDFIVLDGPTASLEVESKALDAVIDGIVTVCPTTASRGVEQVQQLFSQKRFSAFATSQ